MPGLKLTDVHASEFHAELIREALSKARATGGDQVLKEAFEWIARIAYLYGLPKGNYIISSTREFIGVSK